MELDDEDLEKIERELDIQEAHQIKQIKEMEDELRKRRAKWRRRIQLKCVRMTSREGVIQRLREELNRTQEFAETPSDQSTDHRESNQSTNDPVDPIAESSINEPIEPMVEQPAEESSNQLRDQMEETTGKEPEREETEERREKEKEAQEVGPKPSQIWYWRKKGDKGRFVPKEGHWTEARQESITPEIRMLTQDPKIPFEVRKIYMRRLTRGGPGPNITPGKEEKEKSSSKESGAEVKEPERQWWQRPNLYDTSDEEEREGNGPEERIRGSMW